MEDATPMTGAEPDGMAETAPEVPGGGRKERIGQVGCREHTGTAGRRAAGGKNRRDILTWLRVTQSRLTG